MTIVENIAWVSPPQPIRGLDHLGVQAPCTTLYTQLLPGITNVTDRARYYAFYPWVIWSFERRYADHSLDEFRRVLRRAECLFALIAIRHARALGDADHGRHGIGMVGRFELLRIGDDVEEISLDEYAALEGPRRYFKNKLGGLGQYYFGPLRDLSILDHSDQGVDYPPGYGRERGREIAEAFAKGVEEEAFFRVLEASAIAWSDLDELASFCPCALRGNPVEHELLLDVFLARTAAYEADGDHARRASLGLMLDLAARGGKNPDYTYEALLRGASYAGVLSDGSPWELDGALLRARRGWGTYQRNELLSLAVQGLFAAILRAVERDHQGVLRESSDAADVGERLLSSFGARLSRPLADEIAHVRGELPPLANWSAPEHELDRGWRLAGLGLEDDQLENVAVESLQILLALLARGVDEYPYADFELDPEYFDPQEVHLLSLRQASRTTWAAMSLGEWIRWLSVHWCVGRHLRVALRKLRAERRDTFRIRPLEGELRVVEAPAPTFTLPRVTRAVQILRDLDLIDLEADGLVLTERGRAALEVCRGG
ncbi:hypothetical protein WMF26_24815 [Sorangium sp. So ce185]|uniref:hypothetical protein n=1 Tax=Sorangium sp. So ce185 TaxID=3133287 RepID=UPI003F5F0AEF